MGNYRTEVRLLAYTGSEAGLASLLPNPELLIEFAGRKCYANEDELGTNPEWIQARIRDGHESILEHASATFLIKASRAFTHELVRHRIASYSQRSQRYVDETEPRYIAPEELTGMERVIFREAMRLAWEAYEGLRRCGVPKEIARYVLPNACETQIVMTMNFRELRHFIKLRTSKRALPEMQEVAGKVREICKEIAPKVFEDV